jgi:hypothetical protein
MALNERVGLPFSEVRTKGIDTVVDQVLPQTSLQGFLVLCPKLFATVRGRELKTKFVPLEHADHGLGFAGQ